MKKTSTDQGRHIHALRQRVRPYNHVPSRSYTRRTEIEEGLDMTDLYLVSPSNGEDYIPDGDWEDPWIDPTNEDLDLIDKEFDPDELYFGLGDDYDVEYDVP